MRQTEKTKVLTICGAIQPITPHAFIVYCFSTAMIGLSLLFTFVPPWKHQIWHSSQTAKRQISVLWRFSELTSWEMTCTPTKWHATVTHGFDPNWQNVHALSQYIFRQASKVKESTVMTRASVFISNWSLSFRMPEIMSLGQHSYYESACAFCCPTVYV
jgi:hypothetical protein